MSEAGARQVLGVAAGAGPGEIRTAYRSAIKRCHPDVAGAESGPRAAAVTEAYRVLTTGGVESPAAPAAPPPRPSASPASARRAPLDIDGAVLRVRCDLATAWAVVLAAADRLGSLTYVDRSCGVADVAVTLADGSPGSMLLTFHRQGDDALVVAAVEAITRAEAIDPRPHLEALIAAAGSQE